MYQKKKKKIELTDQDRLVELGGNLAPIILLLGCFLKVMFF